MKILIHILSVDVIWIAGYQLLDKLEIFSTQLTPIVHEFDVLFSPAMFYRWRHFHNP